MGQGGPVPTRIAAGADTGFRLTSPRAGWDGGTRTLAPRFKGAGAALDIPDRGRGGRTRTFEDLVQGQAPSPLGHAPVGWVDAVAADGLKGARAAGPCPWASGSSGGLPGAGPGGPPQAVGIRIPSTLNQLAWTLARVAWVSRPSDRSWRRPRPRSKCVAGTNAAALGLGHGIRVWVRTGSSLGRCSTSGMRLPPPRKHVKRFLEIFFSYPPKPPGTGLDPIRAICPSSRA